MVCVTLLHLLLLVYSLFPDRLEFFHNIPSLFLSVLDLSIFSSSLSASIFSNHFFLYLVFSGDPNLIYFDILLHHIQYRETQISGTIQVFSYGENNYHIQNSN